MKVRKVSKIIFSFLGVSTLIAAMVISTVLAAKVFNFALGSNFGPVGQFFVNMPRFAVAVMTIFLPVTFVIGGFVSAVGGIVSSIIRIAAKVACH